MRLLTYLYFVSFGIYLSVADMPIKEVGYIPLLKTIRKYYFAHAIVFVQPVNDHKDFDVFVVRHLTHTWTRLLQKNHIAISSITFENMNALSKNCGSMVRPLIVVLIPGPHAYNEFSKITKNFKMSCPAWFVVFLPTPENALHDYCYRPSGNPFHLAFNTKMLVMCPGDNVLYEWYSVDRKSTEIFKLGKWDVNSPQSIELFTNLSLYERRNDLKGIVLRGVTVQTSILLKVYDKEVYGYFGKIMRELEHALNFTIEIVAEEIEYGNFNETTKSWSGAMRSVVTGKADIGVCDFSMTNDRLDYVDFTVPLLTVRQNLFYKQPAIFAVKWFAYFKCFTPTVWISLIGLLFVAQIITSFMRRWVNSLPITQVMYEECLRVWGIVCLQGLTEFPRNSSLKLAYFSVFILALVISSTYSASLTCFMTARIVDAPFRTVDEFLKDGTYRVIAIKGSAEYHMAFSSNDHLSNNMQKLMKSEDSQPMDMITGFKSICNDNKLAFYTAFGHHVQKRSADVYIPCTVFSIYVGRMESMSMILTKDNQYTPVFNYHLQKLLSTGVLNRYINREVFRQEPAFQPVEFGNIVSVLMAFICAVIVALVTLTVEICFHNYKRPRF